MTQNLVKNIIGNVASSYQLNLTIEISNISKNYINSHFHLSTLGIINAYLNIRHVDGLFLDWPDIFGRAGNLWECVRKTRYEISYKF